MAGAALGSIMTFNSPHFLGFLALAAVVHALLPARVRPSWLLLASFGFYFTWSVAHTLVLVLATGVAWLAARRIEHTEDEREKLTSLRIAVGMLLASLLAFKYGPTLSRGLLPFVAPIGISYYTFKLISYVVDAYWGTLGPARSLLDVARYAAFFPQLLSGPIQRPADFFEQSKVARVPGASLVASGLRLMLFGYFKKFVVADRAALLVDQVFEQPRSFSTELVWLAAYLFSIQLYADFSGFTDIAIGAGRLFGVCAPKNFDSPYYAANIQEFWRRWHMTLTKWLGDYVFMPLRIATREWGKLGLVASIAGNMLLVGVWHGPSLTFVLFGLLNALYFSVSALTLPARNKWFKQYPRLSRPRAIVGAMLVFNLMTFAFISFRARSVNDASHMMQQFVRGMFVGPAHARSFIHGSAWASVDGWSSRDVLILVIGGLIMETVHALQTRGRIASVFGARPRWVRWAAYYALIGATALLSTQNSRPFIYLRF